MSEAKQNDRIVREDELGANDGQEGRPAYVVYKGKVYDVSQSRLWRNGVHVRRHHAGNDLTTDFAAAPHDESVLGRVELVGVLAVAEEEEEEQQNRLMALLDLYFDFHPHPVAVHFPVALGAVFAIFLVLYLLTGNTAFELSSYHMLWVALIMSPIAMFTGVVSWGFNYGRVLDGRFSAKMSLSIVLVIVEAFALALRTANPSIVLDREPLGRVYLLAALATVILVASLGWIGAKITFPPRRK